MGKISGGSKKLRTRRKQEQSKKVKKQRNSNESKKLE